MDCYVTRIQALYDLREVTAWISVEELQDMLFTLLSRLSPSGLDLMDLDGLKEQYPEAYELLSQENYCVVTQRRGLWSTWTTPKKKKVKKMNMVAASMFAHQMRGIAVTIQQAEFLEGKEVDVVRVENGLIVSSTTEDRQLVRDNQMTIQDILNINNEIQLLQLKKQQAIAQVVVEKKAEGMVYFNSPDIDEEWFCCAGSHMLISKKVYNWLIANISDRFDTWEEAEEFLQEPHTPGCMNQAKLNEYLHEAWQYATDLGPEHLIDFRSM